MSHQVAWFWLAITYTLYGKLAMNIVDFVLQDHRRDADE